MSITHTEYTSSTQTVSKTHVLLRIQSVVHTLYQWADRAKKRRELRELLASDNHIFSDIGLQRHDVAREAFKRFWVA